MLAEPMLAAVVKGHRNQSLGLEAFKKCFSQHVQKNLDLEVGFGEGGVLLQREGKNRTPQNRGPNCVKDADGVDPRKLAPRVSGPYSFGKTLLEVKTKV